MNEKVVGILLNASVYKGIAKQATKHEVLTLYEQAASSFNIVPCYFRLQDIDPGDQEITAYIHTKKGFVKKKVPAPRIIHNRALYMKDTANRKIRRLEQAGTIVFNAKNRYGKLDIHRLLNEDAVIAPHLPETHPADEQSIMDMIQRYPSIIIKPNSSSIGRGIIKIERSETDWTITYPTKSKKLKKNIWRSLRWNGRMLPSFLTKRLARKPHLVQETIQLTQYQGRPFDFRVSVQKDGSGCWQVTGVVAKLAARNKFVTNVAQGGTVYPLELIIRSSTELHPNRARRSIEQLALRVAARLDRELPHLADLGMDIGIDGHGTAYFIECNGRDLRYSFREGGLFKEWKDTYANPIAYASFLLRQQSLLKVSEGSQVGEDD